MLFLLDSCFIVVVGNLKPGSHALHSYDIVDIEYYDVITESIIDLYMLCTKMLFMVCLFMWFAIDFICIILHFHLCEKKVCFGVKVTVVFRQLFIPISAIIWFFGKEHAFDHLLTK